MLTHREYAALIRLLPPDTAESIDDGACVAATATQIGASVA